MKRVQFVFLFIAVLFLGSAFLAQADFDQSQNLTHWDSSEKDPFQGETGEEESSEYEMEDDLNFSAVGESLDSIGRAFPRHKVAKLKSRFIETKDKPPRPLI